MWFLVRHNTYLNNLTLISTHSNFKDWPDCSNYGRMHDWCYHITKDDSCKSNTVSDQIRVSDLLFPFFVFPYLVDFVFVINESCSIYIFRYEHSHGRRMSTAAAAQLMSVTLYYKRFFPYYAFCMIAGLDEDGESWDNLVPESLIIRVYFIYSIW